MPNRPGESDTQARRGGVIAHFAGHSHDEDEGPTAPSGIDPASWPIRNAGPPRAQPNSRPDRAEVLRDHSNEWSSRQNGHRKGRQNRRTDTARGRELRSDRSARRHPPGARRTTPKADPQVARPSDDGATASCRGPARQEPKASKLSPPARPRLHRRGFERPPLTGQHRPPKGESAPDARPALYAARKPLAPGHPRAVEDGLKSPGSNDAPDRSRVSRATRRRVRAASRSRQAEAESAMDRAVHRFHGPNLTDERRRVRCESLKTEAVRTERSKDAKAQASQTNPKPGCASSKPTPIGRTRRSSGPSGPKMPGPKLHRRTPSPGARAASRPPSGRTRRSSGPRGRKDAQPAGASNRQDRARCGRRSESRPGRARLPTGPPGSCPASGAKTQGSTKARACAESRQREKPLNPASRVQGLLKIGPAATYSPTRFPVQYHRLWRA